MSLEITLLVLIAAALHAGWNALIKISGDRIAVMAVVTLAGAVLSLFALPFVESPAPASWPLLALSILIHTGYHFFLPVAYDHGDLGQVYPIARGAAPILVTVGAFVFAGESVSGFALVGIGCLAVGVMALTFDGGKASSIKPKAVFFALATGVCIAAYTVVDGLGARQAGSILGFAVWLTIGDGILTFLIALIWKRREITGVIRDSALIGFAAGAMQIGAYWIIVYALAVAPMAMVSGLRETSVLFAALISTFILKEGFGVWRFVSATLVTFGLIVSRARN
ncbi:EamA family transporter [Marivita hallyeonensis]|uniref:EamA-like transporter family protein n=1 Tax=Marivita hallyeonensis TaxID=996342 RepID=A0A1M5QJL5_9RHOB|nr:EamA family transporter [Marivita hallyeonensis]SHH14061.1 EamA-like transporter family protein [Marivita hallyeonensis]